MGELFPVDLTSLFTEAIAEDKRPPDGKLHASSDLTGSLRHVQLRALGVPAKPSSIASQIRLMTGTLWHRWLQELLVRKGIRVWTEIKLDEYLPDGWSGTADYVFYHPEYEAFVLGDLKTTKGESIFFVNRDGAKEEHIWQLSSYFHGLVAMGLPMVEQVGVLYLPMNDISSGDSPDPTLQEVKPLDESVVWKRMTERAFSVQRVREQIAAEGYHVVGNGPLDISEWNPHKDNSKLLESLTTFLAPEQERIQKLVWDGRKSIFNVVLTPHWSAAYCDWEPPICQCSLQGTTKIGQYDLDGTYTPRKGYEDTEITVTPSEKELNRRRA